MKPTTSFSGNGPSTLKPIVTYSIFPNETSYRRGITALDSFFEKTLTSLTNSDLVERVLIVSHEMARFKMPRCRVLLSGPLPSQEHSA